MLIKAKKLRITKQDFEAIFLNVMHLIPIHTIILEDLERLLKNHRRDQLIGALFNKMGHFLKLYITYCQGYDNALLKLKECIQKVFFFFVICLNFMYFIYFYYYYYSFRIVSSSHYYQPSPPAPKSTRAWNHF
jgi:hypothetical protein